MCGLSVSAEICHTSSTDKRADGSNPVGFFVVQKCHFGAILAVLMVRMVKLYVRMTEMALGR